MSDQEQIEDLQRRVSKLESQIEKSVKIDAQIARNMELLTMGLIQVQDTLSKSEESEDE